MIGVFDELPFLNQGEVIIEPGSMIFNYTDGLMDYELEQDIRWNEGKLVSYITDNGHLPPDQFNQNLMDYLARIIKGKRIDDITLLTLRIT